MKNKWKPKKYQNGDKILDTPIKDPNNRYNLTPRLLAGVGSYGFPVVYDPKEYLNSAKTYGFVDDPYYVKEANDALDSGEGYFEMSPLQEVVVTPSKSDYQLMKKAQKLIPNKAIRTSLYGVAEKHTDKHSSNYGVNRLLDLYKFAGSPKVVDYGSGTDILSPIKFPDGSPRPHYKPINRTMYLTRDSEMSHKYGSAYDPSMFIAELAHPYLENIKGWSRLGAISRYIKLGKGDDKVDGKTGYLRPDHFEYLTHSIVQPALEGYIDSEESLNQLNDNILKRIETARFYDIEDDRKLSRNLFKLKRLADLDERKGKHEPTPLKFDY